MSARLYRLEDVARRAGVSPARVRFCAASLREELDLLQDRRGEPVFTEAQVEVVLARLGGDRDQKLPAPREPRPQAEEPPAASPNVFGGRTRAHPDNGQRSQAVSGELRSLGERLDRVLAHVADLAEESKQLQILLVRLGETVQDALERAIRLPAALPGGALDPGHAPARRSAVLPPDERARARPWMPPPLRG